MCTHERLEAGAKKKKDKERTREGRPEGGKKEGGRKKEKVRERMENNPTASNEAPLDESCL